MAPTAASRACRAAACLAASTCATAATAALQAAASWTAPSSSWFSLISSASCKEKRGQRGCRWEVEVGIGCGRQTERQLEERGRPSPAALPALTSEERQPRQHDRGAEPSAALTGTQGRQRRREAGR